MPASTGWLPWKISSCRPTRTRDRSCARLICVAIVSSKIVASEEEMVKSVAPSLVPALGKLLKYLEKHGAMVFGLLFLGLTVPRVVLLAKLGRDLKRMEKTLMEASEARAKRASEAAASRAGSAAGAAPPPFRRRPRSRW